MFVVRPTQSLAKKMSIKLPAREPEITAVGRLGEWYGGEFNLSSSRFILFLSSTTRLGLVIKAAPYSSLMERMIEELGQLLSAIGIGSAKIEEELIRMERPTFLKTANRSLLGTINELIGTFTYIYQYHGEMKSTHDMSMQTLKVIMRPLGWKHPIDLVRAAFSDERIAPHPPEMAKEPDPTVFRFPSSRGDFYFVHEKLTSKNNPSYYVSRDSAGALKCVPEGYEVTETPGRVVTVRKQFQSAIPQEDELMLRESLKSFQWLKNYRIEKTKDALIVYQPDSDRLINEKPTREILEHFSPLAPLRDVSRMLKKPLDRAITEAFKSTGLTLEEIYEMAENEARAKHRAFQEKLLQETRYSPIMRFILTSLDGGSRKYSVERRQFVSDGKPWQQLNDGPLFVLVKKYLRHLGKDSFFELW